MAEENPNLKTSFEQMFNRKLTDEEYSECQRNLFGFFEVLLKIKKRQQEGLTGEN